MICLFNIVNSTSFMQILIIFQNVKFQLVIQFTAKLKCVSNSLLIRKVVLPLQTLRFL